MIRSSYLFSIKKNENPLFLVDISMRKRASCIEDNYILCGILANF